MSTDKRLFENHTAEFLGSLEVKTPKELLVKLPDRNPDFVQHVGEMRDLHDRKSHDYSRDDNVYSNFEYAAQVAAPFTDPVDKVFAVLVGIKLARLAELRSGKTPLNESILDTLLDKDNYMVIWSSRLRKMMREENERKEKVLNP